MTTLFPRSERSSKHMQVNSTQLNLLTSGYLSCLLNMINLKLWSNMNSSLISCSINLKWSWEVQKNQWWTASSRSSSFTPKSLTITKSTTTPLKEKWSNMCQVCLKSPFSLKMKVQFGPPWERKRSRIFKSYLPDSVCLICWKIINIIFSLTYNTLRRFAVVFCCTTGSCLILPYSFIMSSSYR